MGQRQPVRWGHITAIFTGITVSLWPLYGLEYVNVTKITKTLLPTLPVFVGFLTLSLTLQRDVGWLQRQSWRRVNVERRLADRNLNAQVFMLSLYIVSFVTMIIHSGLIGQNLVVRILPYVYLTSSTAALYMTLFLPFVIKNMRILPYDDLIDEKLDHRRAA